MLMLLLLIIFFFCRAMMFTPSAPCCCCCLLSIRRLRDFHTLDFTPPYCQAAAAAATRHAAALC